MTRKILAYQLRPGMHVWKDGKPDCILTESFTAIGWYHVAFTAVSPKDCGLVVWPRLAIVEVAGQSVK